MKSKTPLWDERKQRGFIDFASGTGTNNFDEFMEYLLERAKKNDYEVEFQIMEENSGFCI